MPRRGSRPAGGSSSGYTRGSCVFRSLCCLWVAPPVLVTRGGFLIGGFFFGVVIPITVALGEVLQQQLLDDDERAFD